MKILYVLDCYPILSETFIRDEIEEMQRQGNEIIIATFNYGDKEIKLPNNLKPSYILNELYYSKKEAAKKLISLATKISFALKQDNIPTKEMLYHSLKISDLALKHNVDRIHAHFGLNASAFVIQAALFSNKKSSFTVHGYDVNKVNADIKTKMMYVDNVVSVSQFLKDEMTKKNNLSLELQNKIKVIPFGIKTHLKRAEKSKRNEKYLFVGRFNEVKGIDHILDAWSKNKALPQIDLIGFGKEKDELNLLKKIKEKNLNIKVLGKRNSVEIFDAMSQYKAIVLPFKINSKTGERDTGAIVAKEAMLNKIPIITTDLIPHIVSKECGYIAKMNDSISLLKQISYFENLNENEINKKTEFAYNFVKKNYSINKQVEDFIKWIKI